VVSFNATTCCGADFFLVACGPSSTGVLAFPLSKTDKSLLGLPLSPVNRLAEFPLDAFNLLKMWMKFEFAAGGIKRNGSAIYHMGGNFCLVVRKIPGYDFSVYH